MINTTPSSAFSFDELLFFEIVEQLDADRDKGVPADEAFDADRDKGVPGSSTTVEVRLTLEQLEAFDDDRIGRVDFEISRLIRNHHFHICTFSLE